MSLVFVGAQVIAMDLQNMQQETDSIRSIPSATCNAEGEDCADGDEQTLVRPIIVTASKSRVRLRYPVTYSHMTFVSRPPARNARPRTSR